MESILGASDEILQDYLQFKTPPVSTSVLSRKGTRWYPSGNQFGPNGVKQLKVIRSDTAGGGWLLPWTLSLRLLVTCKSGADNQQTLRMPIHGIFGNLELNFGGFRENGRMSVRNCTDLSGRSLPPLILRTSFTSGPERRLTTLEVLPPAITRCPLCPAGP